MDVREATGYAAHALLGLYWLWVVSCTAPQLRRSMRDRAVRVRILLIKTAAVVVTSLVVGVIHFWATQWWQVVAALVVGMAAGAALRKAYRRRVAAPRHRATLVARARKASPVRRGDQDVPRRSHSSAPARSSSS